MKQIIIRNFGPVDSMKMDIQPINVLVGPQASGKSTVSKLIYFYRSIPETLYGFLLKEAIPEADVLFEFNKVLIQKFVGYFGTTKHMRPFSMTYTYAANKKVDMYWKDGYVQITFSDELRKSVYQVARQIKRIEEENASSKGEWDTTFFNVRKKKSYAKLRQEIYDSFEETLTPIFIPAGRSLVTTLADELQLLFKGIEDDLLQQFIERIQLLRRSFSKSLEDIIEERKILSFDEIDEPNVKLAIDIIEQVLKGRYIYRIEGERIYFNEKEFINLNFSSSGQQEVVWILLLLFSFILEKRNVFLVIEEPEAHLFPTAQHQIVALMGLLVNTSDSEMIITTHSPYILSSLNTYIYAGQLSDKLDQQRSKLVQKPLRIKKQVSAYYVERTEDTFTATDILDDDLKLIQAEVIDNISNDINKLFDQLLDVEVSP